MAFLSSRLLREARFAHGFSTREIDLAFGAPGRDETLVAFARDAGLGDDVREANQVHGACVVAAADVASGARPDGDALVSPHGGPAVGVRVADCVPILVGDRASGRVAAIHAGWRGLVAGVIEAALARLDAREPIAAVGPCIGACCFEVGRDVGERICAASGPVIARDLGAKVMVDLRRAAHAVLGRAGVASIDDVGGCTVCESERFFSFRRGGEMGRMLGAIRPYCG